MNKKLLYTALSIVIASVFFIGYALYINKSESTILRGDLLFKETVSSSLDVKKIVITTPEYKTTLIQNDDFWRIEENNNYYANLILINEFLIFLNEAKVLNSFGSLSAQSDDNRLQNPKDANIDREQAGILIETFDHKNQKLNSIILGEKQGNYIKARQSDSNFIWLINRGFSFPSRNYSWLLEPLLDIDPGRVTKIQIESSQGNKSVQKAQNSPYFYDTKGAPVEVLPLLSQFVYLIFTDVKNSASFDKTTAKEGNIFHITMDNGLIYNIKIIENNKKYYIALSLSTTTLPTVIASDYIKDNAFLYKNWYFEISPQKGRLLFNY